MLQQAANVRRINIGTGLWWEEPSLPVRVFIQFLGITSPETGYSSSLWKQDQCGKNAIRSRAPRPHKNQWQLQGTRTTPKLKARPLVCDHEWIFNVREAPQKLTVSSMPHECKTAETYTEYYTRYANNMTSKALAT